MKEEVKEAVILAAGRGRRLRRLSNVPKFAFTLLGRPLIHYPLLSLSKAGIERFTIIVAKGYHRLAERTLSRLNVDYEIVENDRPEKGNGYTLFYSEGRVKRFFVSMCDHIYLPSIPIGMTLSYTNTDLLIGTDSKPSYVDVSEATKIALNEEGSMKIGKKLKDFSYIDLGLFIMNERIFGLRKAVEQTDEITLSELLVRAVESGITFSIYDVKGLPWRDVDTPKDVKDLLTGKGKKVIELWRKEVL